MRPIKRPIQVQDLGQLQAGFVGLPIFCSGADVSKQAPIEQSSGPAQREGSLPRMKDNSLQWNRPPEQNNPLHLQMEETRLNPQDDPMKMDISGPGSSQAEQDSPQKTFDVSEATDSYIPHQSLDIGESRRSTPGSIHKSISPNTSSRGFPTFENTFNSETIASPGRGIQSPENTSQRSEKEEFQDIFSELMTGTEHEIAFLTRHYSEVIGPWYIFDSPSSVWQEN